MVYLLWLALLWLIGWIAALWWYRGRLLAWWHEPMLRQPVLILESDDWGPGPALHAERLQRLAELLASFHDRFGQPPVATLGVVLAVPDTARIAQGRPAEYRRLMLDDARCAAVLEAIRDGLGAGVFAVQLHGMEHYWPATLMQLAERDAAIRDWLIRPGIPDTEALPAQLQSRWTDTAQLPSRVHPDSDIEAAVGEEIGCFARVFGFPPRVVVPPTFLWTSTVERAWAAHGVSVIVTPGRRYEARDRDGRLLPAGDPIVNGASPAPGTIYLVRDSYFEPALGHTAEAGSTALARDVPLGRPVLLEMHRFNFTAEEHAADAAYRELRDLLRRTLAEYPEVRFMSSQALAESMRRADSELVVADASQRVAIWLRRAGQIGRLRKLAWLSGAIVLVWLVQRTLGAGR